MCLGIFLLGATAAYAQESGSIVGWGSQVVVEQSALEDLAAIAAGSFHSLGLKSDGTIVAWGQNNYGQCNVPSPNADFVAVAGGDGHSLGLKRSIKCAIPEIVSHDPPLVNSENCSEGCTVNFSVGTQDDYTGVSKIILERRLNDSWIPEDSVLAPLPAPPWTLGCVFNEHYTDGDHVFRVVFHCLGGSSAASGSVTVVADRGVPVAIAGFEPEYSNGGVVLHWTIAQGARLQGFTM